MPTLVTGFDASERPGDRSPEEYIFILDDEQPISLNIIKAVAQIECIKPHEMEDLLHEYIDPDSINSLYKRQKDKIASDVELEFSFGCYRVMLDCSTITLKKYRYLE